MQAIQLTLKFRILTPLFMGGADNKLGKPELRVPSIKGALRFWYRALDPQWNIPLSNDKARKKITREMAWFGGTEGGVGQSPFLLHLNGPQLTKVYQWPERASPGMGYLGYPFRGWKDSPSRQAIAPGQDFTLEIRVLRHGNDPNFRRALTACLWCLGNVGSLGSRSRRGFGALALTEWRKQGVWPEFEELPLLNDIPDTNPGIWLSRFEKGRKVFADWFPPAKRDAGQDETQGATGQSQNGRVNNGKRPQPHFSPDLRRILLNHNFALADWQEVLELMGGRMQEYRARRSPDYEDVKAHLEHGARLAQSPQRCAFGLPLTFRYRSLQGKSTTFYPFNPQTHEKYERHGSLLLLRPILVGERLFPLFLRMDGEVPGHAPPAAPQGRHAPLPPEVNGMDDFLSSLGKGGR